MIHSDSHQINARWHGLPSWRRRLAPSRQVLREYRHKCVLMPRPVSLLHLPASHFHITYLVSLINFVLRLSSRSRSSILRRRYLPDTVDSRIEPSLTISPSFLSLSLSLCVFPLSSHIISVSLSPCLLVSRDFARATAPSFSLSSLSSMRNSMLRVNIMESPRILGGLLSAAQGSKQISKWHGK